MCGNRTKETQDVCELDNSRAHRKSQGRTSFILVCLPCHCPFILICLEKIKEKQGWPHFVHVCPTLPSP